MPRWSNIAFESQVRDSRPILECEYDGLRLYIKPSQDEYSDLIAVFSRSDSDVEDIRLRVNRFLSAMAWKDGKAYLTLSSAGAGTASFDEDQPLFFYQEKRRSPYVTIDRYDFEHLQVVKGREQTLALALYRDALGVNNEFYRFLSFYKIINIRHDKGKDQKRWINSNVTKLGQSRSWTAYEACERLKKLNLPDTGDYLYKQGRNAIAHAFARPVRDPDIPSDRIAIAQDTRIMRALAELFVEQELNVPSVGTIYREHLYELAGFKTLFGTALSEKLKRGDDIAASELPLLPPLSLTLKEHGHYSPLENLEYETTAYKAGVVILTALQKNQPVQVELMLDFPRERLELLLEGFGVVSGHQAYSKHLEASLWHFLIEYFRNGILEVYDASSGARLSLKDAFIPENIDLSATLSNWRKRLELLEGKANS